MKQGVLGDLKDGRYCSRISSRGVWRRRHYRLQQRRRLAQRGRLRRYSRLGRQNRQTVVDVSYRAPARGAGLRNLASGSWKNRSGTNVWGFFTVDVKRGIVYAPLGSPTSDFYGADRIGDDLYGNSARRPRRADRVRENGTSKLVHHDLWDYDLAAPPALFDIRRNGTVIPAVAQITKMGLLFVFDRVTGEPVYGVEERAVPQTAIPGEVTSKTQPFPVKPPPLAKNTFRHRGNL